MKRITQDGEYRAARWILSLEIIHHRLLAGAVFLVWMVVFIPCAAVTDDKTAGTIEETRTALEKWVETQRVISKEKRDLELSKEMLNERIELVRREIQSLLEKITDAEKSIAEADKKRADLIQENDLLKEVSIELVGVCTSLEENTIKLLTRLPDPIREHIKPLSQRLPDRAEETKLTISERFQNVVGILNEIGKFNRDIRIVSEVRMLPDGTSAEVTALYLGLGQGYYSGANGTIAGIGTVSEEGWAWKPANDAAGEIAKAISILKNEQVASFVRLPIEIK